MLAGETRAGLPVWEKEIKLAGLPKRLQGERGERVLRCV